MTETPITVLWTANIVVPVVARDLRLPEVALGGWLSTTTERLAKQPGFRVGVAMRAPVKTLRRIEKVGITYFAIPQRLTNAYDVGQADVDRVLGEFAPDILHAEGTEMAYTRRMLRSWTGKKLVSLQGVINGHPPYQLGRLPVAEMANPLRPRRLAVALALLANKRLRFLPRLKAERETIGMAEHILGRTLWDRAQANRLNPEARYHHCPRILRDAFYRSRWSMATCERFSIFIGSGDSPLKGAHFAVRALALLRRRFPLARLYIAGRSPYELPRFSANNLFGYAVYLCELIDELDLRDHVEFTGSLDAEAMAKRMSRSHVFVLSSLIENSPNTLAEAMLLGVPAVSAYTGGAPSMARDEGEALFYRADDPAMLALQVQRLFQEEDLCQRLSAAARDRALTTHDPEVIMTTLVSVYRTILTRA